MPAKEIKSQSILPRIDGIQSDVEKLGQLGQLSLEKFSEELNFVAAQFYLRRALEGVFHIGSHLLSRLPGGRATEYKDIALKMGQLNLIEKGFAESKLKAMAGYRNRLTHFYADIKPKELYEIIKNDLPDFEVYLRQIKQVLQNLDKFNLTLE